MPTYGFKCPKCGFSLTERRAFARMDDPAPQCQCGALTERVFTPNPNIVVPIAFKQFLRDGSGVIGGGHLAWSDIHGDITERDLARMPGVERYDAAMSQPGFASKDRTLTPAEHRAFGAAYADAKAELAARGEH